MHTTLLLLALSSPAEAASGRSGLLYPGAAVVPPQSGQLDMGAALLPLADGGAPATVTMATLTLSPSKRLTLSAGYGTYESFLGLPDRGIGALGLRWSIIDARVLRVSPFGYALFASERPQDLWTEPIFMVGGAGLAVEVGAERVYVDAAVPALVVDPSGSFVPPTAVAALAGAELGLNVVPKEHHRVRAGMLSMMPIVSYGYEHKHLSLHAGMGADIEDKSPLMMFQGGVTF